MKLRNKKTGEVIETDYELSLSVPNDEKFYGNATYTQIKGYSSIKELAEDWEDYEEPKEYYYINNFGVVQSEEVGKYVANERIRKEIGNYFETEEEAEKAVENLKAWKRLKDKGFRFCGWATNAGIRGIDFEVPDSFFSENNHSFISDETRNDLDLLFGGEE